MKRQPSQGPVAHGLRRKGKQPHVHIWGGFYPEYLDPATHKQHGYRNCVECGAMKQVSITEHENIRESFEIF